MVSPIIMLLLLHLMFCLQSPRHFTWTRELGTNIYSGPTTSQTKFSGFINLVSPSIHPQHLHTSIITAHAHSRSQEGTMAHSLLFTFFHFISLPSVKTKILIILYSLFLYFFLLVIPRHLPKVIIGLGSKKLLCQTVKVDFLLK